jgi:ATP-dependent helicase Lhr and Lhr-like helicase
VKSPPSFQPAFAWFQTMGWSPFDFQTQSWEAYFRGLSGLVNAPTGSGKTYSLLIPILLEGMNQPQPGIKAIWITPIRALAKEIELSSQRAIQGLGLTWKVGVRTGDTSTRERTRQKEQPPDILITTPESLHLLLAQKGYPDTFRTVSAIVVDEWHELLGSKRGVQMELALSRLKNLLPALKIWGISATIGNLEQAKEILLGNSFPEGQTQLIRSNLQKKIVIESILPDEVEQMPWAGHLGIHLLEKIIPIIKKSTSTLIFTNTRSFAEIWYQRMLEHAPELAGLIAMHHSSISQELRSWVEDQLHEGKLKAVVCTSSLDLGVDFRPVETIIQVGSPKGVARFLQRAGRSGHQPGAISRIFFLPTHSLELTEAAALREAIDQNIVEDRLPYVRSFDVLIQYVLTLAVGEGFDPIRLLPEIRSTFSYASITDEEWWWVLNFVTTGGAALTAYDEYRKVIIANGIYKVEDRRVALRHRLSIGTIVGDNSLYIKYISGKYLGTIEEYFIASLKPGDVFWFAGRSLELIRIKDMEVQVRNSQRKTGRVPSWQGGRMPLSSQMSELLRQKIHEAATGTEKDPEIFFLKPLMELQRVRSYIPRRDEFLIEYFQTTEGYHVVMYPFEGRQVHEGMGALLAHRLAQIKPLSFSIAMNDYGFELLCDQEIPIYEAIETNVLDSDNLWRDIQTSINSTEMAKRKFRDIAAISGLVFKGMPGKPIKDRHLQSSSQLFFNVFHEYESNNLLLLQAMEEVMDFQLEEARLRSALQRIAHQKIIIREPDKPTPFAFPIMVDRMREKLSTERIEDRVRKMITDWK